MSDPITPQEAPVDQERQREIEEFRRAIALGFDVEAFMRSAIGTYFRIRASRELEEAQEALIAADASEPAAVRELQLKARVAQRVLTWFGDAVSEGERAEHMYQQAYDEGGGA